MSRRLNLVLGTVLALALSHEGALAQTRPTGAIGYSAAERRVVDQRLANLNQQIERLSSKRAMSPRLVRAIATEVGLANPRFSDAELLTAVEAMAELAEKLRADNEVMRGELNRLRDPALRDPALALLNQAQAALNEGRLDEAEALFGKIRSLRWDESREADEAWGIAVESEARTAELRQEFIRAQDLRLSASDRLLARAEADHRRAFELADTAAQSRLEEGNNFGRDEALIAAISLWQMRVLPLVPRDRYPELWAWAINNLGLALEARGRSRGGAEGSTLLARAVSAYEAALEVRTRADTPADWAKTQNNLGNALSVQGELSGGVEGRELLARAVGAYEAALQVHTSADMLAEWAGTQNNLGNALLAQGERSSEAEGLELLARAVSAFEAALGGYTIIDAPRRWAMAQNNLGNALQEQGARSGGAAGLELLARAVAAYEAALEVRTRAEMPAQWAMTQNNLGNVLSTQGELSDGAAGLAMLAKAVEAYRAALEVRTRADMPADWAATQNNLGNALRVQGERSGGAEGLALLAEAAVALREALEVRSRNSQPAAWALTHFNIAVVEEARGDLSEGAAQAAYWRSAEAAVLLALEVYDPVNMPYNHGRATSTLARIRAKLGGGD